MNIRMKHFQVLKISLIALAAVLILAEIGVRLGGLVDLPTYSTDNEIEYILKPNQSGSFLNKNRWFFNNRSMGIEKNWAPATHPNILLIGNSIVMGGNPFDQPNKLGPLIQQEIGNNYSVWPIAVGGWSDVNEAVYIERNPDVTQAANFFVWEYMFGGLGGANPWAGDYVFPRERPIWATWYVFRRDVLPRLVSLNMNELPATGALDKDNLKQFEAAIAKLSSATGRGTPGILFLYPNEAQYLAAKRGEEWLPDRPELERIAQKYGLKIVDISRMPDWNETFYRDGTHPTVAGNKVLAHILAASITDALAPH